MIPLDMPELMEKFCKVTNRYGMYIRIHVPRDQLTYKVVVYRDEEHQEICAAAPYLQHDECAQIISDQQGVLLFTTEEELDRHYQMTVGDDGPTELNSYNGPVSIYALTCGPEGLRNENT